MGEWAFIQKRCIDSQQAHEKTVKIISHQGITLIGEATSHQMVTIFKCGKVGTLIHSWWS
jgi:hypothetical protein